MNNLYRKIGFTLFAILIFRLGSHIPIVGIGQDVLNSFVDKSQSGILGMFDVLSGGSLSRMSIFALSIFPYISASIAMQLISYIHPDLSEKRKQGDSGRRVIAQYTRYLTIFVALIQGYAMLKTLDFAIGGAVFSDFWIKTTAVTSLVVGAIFLVWLGEQITANGIGNGSSILIFAGIVSNLPSGTVKMFNLVRKGITTTPTVIFILIMLIAIVMTVIVCELAVRKIPVKRPKQYVFGKGMGSQEDIQHMPLKINISGVLPPMFALTVLMTPVTVANFFDHPIAIWIKSNLNHGQPLFIVIYLLLIVLFAFFYSAMVFDVSEVAENFQKGSTYILGVKPGLNTKIYLEKILTLITFIGALYLCVICVIPELINSYLAISLGFSGTTVLIIVNVIVDTSSKIQSHMLGYRYQDIAKRITIKR